MKYVVINYDKEVELVKKKNGKTKVFKYKTDADLEASEHSNAIVVPLSKHLKVDEAASNE